jgi:peptidoglycan lytic transglycosylase
LRASALGPLVILALLAGGCATKAPWTAGTDRRDVDPDSVPDAVPQVEPYSKYGNPPSYEVYGKRYAVLPSSKGFVQTGTASWYGEDFHGKRASNGETYDMYAMTAAHKELPLPTYARVTNLENGRSVVVRITDRGPFVGDRIIDLSWVAAAKLRLATKGTGLVEVRAIDPLDPDPLPPAVLDTGTRYAAADPPTPKRAAPVAVAERTDTGRPASGKATPAFTVVAVRPNAGAATAQAATPQQAGASRQPAQAATTATKALAAASPRVFIQVAAFASRENADRLRTKVSKDLGRAAHVDAAETNGRALHRVRVGPLGSVGEADKLVAKLEALGLNQARVVVD